MTELELFDKVNPRRDLPQATCDVISQVYKVMNLETEQLKQQIEKEKKFSKDVMNNELRLIKLIEKMKSDVMSNIKWADQNKNNPMYCKLNSMINQWELAE